MLDEYYNDFTMVLDKYIKHSDQIDKEWYNICIRTYLCLADVPDNPQEDFHVAFRVPGATRGHIACDKDLIIKDIVFYDTCWGVIGIYDESRKDEMIEEANKFLNTKLNIEDGIYQGKFIDLYMENKGDVKQWLSYKI